MGKKSAKRSFEDKLNRLEEISSLLESDEIDLEKAISLYEEGILLSKECISTLREAELKITELKKKMDDLSKDDMELFEE